MTKLPLALGVGFVLGIVGAMLGMSTLASSAIIAVVAVVILWN